MPDLSLVDRAGCWFLNSGIQESSGGFARYYRYDRAQNHPVSTEITGYAVSTLVYLHSLTGDSRYLEAARRAADFLLRTAWDSRGRVFPFECDGQPPLAYFFDSGIIVRGLLSLWRASGDAQYLEIAAACGRSMARDFAAGTEFHPILSLPGKQPLAREPRWSRAPGCYQLKSAMAWYELAEATGDAGYRAPYDRLLDYALSTAAAFLPGDPDRHRVMDRLHAYCYFLEGLLPVAGQPRCRAAICDGLRRVAECLDAIRAEFERSDVCAQLLRMRLYAEWNGVAPVDRAAAAFEAAQLARFQLEDRDPRKHGGFLFGRKGQEPLPYVNPVSSAFAVQAVALWEQYLAGQAPAHRHALI